MKTTPIFAAFALVWMAAGAQAEARPASTTDELRSEFALPAGARSLPRMAPDTVASTPASTDEARWLAGQRRGVAMSPATWRRATAEGPAVIASTDDARRIAHAGIVCL